MSRALAALVLAGLLTACGSTVSQQQLTTAQGSALQDDGLAPPAGDAALPVAGTPVPVAGTTGATLAAAPGTTGAGSTNATGGQQPGTAPAPGGGTARPAADSSPLRLGLLYVANDEAAASAGVDNGNTFGPRAALDALVRATNARGGLAGRKVEPTFFELSSSSSSYATDLQAACARFAEDARVKVVLSFLGLVDEQFSACLAKAGIAHVNGSYGLGDDQSMKGEPTTVSPVALSADRRSRLVLEQLAAARYLTKDSRIGVLVEGCPYNQRALTRTFLPTARRLGLTVASQQQTRCFGGLDDLGGLASDAQNAVLRFRQEQVDKVLVLSAVEANVLLVFATGAEGQGYRPGYGLTSLALANVLKENVPSAQLTGARGVGWIPTTDDAPVSFTTTPATRACVQTLQAQGVAPASATDHYTVFSQCDTFGLAGQVLAAAGGGTSPAAWSAGLDAVGTAFHGAAAYEGRTDFGDGRRDGPAAGRSFAWDGGCSCFRYTGASFPIR